MACWRLVLKLSEVKHTGVLIFAKCGGGNPHTKRFWSLQSAFSRVNNASRRLGDSFVSKLSILENSSGSTGRYLSGERGDSCFFQRESSRLKVARWWGGNKSFGSGNSGLWLPTWELATLGSHFTESQLHCLLQWAHFLYFSILPVLSFYTDWMWWHLWKPHV